MATEAVGWRRFVVDRAGGKWREAFFDTMTLRDMARVAWRYGIRLVPTVERRDERRPGEKPEGWDGWAGPWTKNNYGFYRTYFGAHPQSGKRVVLGLVFCQLVDSVGDTKVMRAFPGSPREWRWTVSHRRAGAERVTLKGRAFTSWGAERAARKALTRLVADG